MKEATQQLIQREDYTAPAYWIDTVNLTFDLDPVKTRVLNCMRVRPNPHVTQPQPLRLDGEELDLSRVLINGQGATFRIEQTQRGNQLVLEKVPDEAFDLEIFTVCRPDQNTECQGLYVSQGALFTQCEAESFRRITYFLDRPDVMATYTVTLRANKALYPVLLSNGNLTDQGDLPDSRHYAVWHDPFPKPSYLFALVAGTLACREQRIRSSNGKSHTLQVYVRQSDLEKTEYAMNSLINAIAWDEARFGLSLDLDRYMIVAVSDFNMGAMENKGLNIFNTKYVLANSATATDDDFMGIESVIGHEYFHNWTGNRITCRDWFQLTLKEGLTVFRDQEFSMDMAGTPSARAIKRIEDVRALRTRQFPEDAGPMAHPIRPDAYEQVDNFYTTTIYEKGAEVIRMMQTLVGRAGFAKGITLYFKRFDGQAVTCDDFIQAIADANPASALAQHLAQFKRWYAQAGTPHVKASGWYDAEQNTYKLTLTQSCPATVGQPTKEPFVIPVAVGLIAAADGLEIPLQFANEEVGQDGTRVLTLTETEQSWTFVNIDTQPVPSLLRNFSAPVILEIDMPDAHWLALLAHDTNPFNRWEAAQRLALARAIHFVNTGEPVQLDAPYVNAMRNVLLHASLDAGFKALVLTLPSEIYMAEQFNIVDPERIHTVRQAMLNQLALALQEPWIATWKALSAKTSYELTPQAMGKRALANMALANICRAAMQNNADNRLSIWEGKAYQRFKDTDNMTDRLGALAALQACTSSLLQPAMDRFLNLYHSEALVVDKWFSLQATASDHDGNVLARVHDLLKHPDFSLKNPNRVRSLISAYCQNNPAAFHRIDGAGYDFWVQQVLALNKTNAQIAARLARALDNWSKLAQPYREKALAAIQKVASHKDLAAEVKEIISRALQPASSNETSKVAADTQPSTSEPQA